MESEIAWHRLLLFLLALLLCRRRRRIDAGLNGKKIMEREGEREGEGVGGSLREFERERIGE